MAGKVIQLGILLKLLDKVSGPASKVNRSLGQTQSRAEAVGKSMQKVGAIVAATGAAMTAASFKIVSSTFASQKALGELASLGFKDLKVMENAARQTSNRFAGITKPAFITAAYDIKSAISNLSDSAVADYTRISAVTAKATKGSVEQMGDLFATGYGIYKELFPKMSDARFAEVFSGAIAKTVKEFKMTGPKIAEYVSMLGATATKQRVGLAEQFAIGGMLGATMSGSEAATKYTAILKNPVDAAKKLGLKFTDANNRLLPMADILDRIRGKYGDYIDAVEKGQLVEAFGRIEGVKLVELLIGKTEELRRKTLMVQEAMGEGAKVATDMAELIDRPIGERWILFKQQFHNLFEKIGITIEPLTRKIFGFLSKITLGFQGWVDAHPALTKLGMSILMVGGALLSVAGILTVLGGSVILFNYSMGGLKFMLFAVKYASVIMGNSVVAAMAKASAAVWTFMTTTPVGWVLLAISAIALGAYLIIKHWDKVGPFLSKVASGIAGAFIWLWNQIKIGIDWFLSLPGVLFEAGKKMMISLMDGIKSVAMLPIKLIINIAQKIRDLWPFSDPRDPRSPLRGIYRAGIGLTNQIAYGIERGTPKIRKAAFNAALAAGLSIAPAVTGMATPGLKLLSPEAAASTDALYKSGPWARSAFSKDTTSLFELSKASYGGLRQIDHSIGKLILDVNKDLENATKEITRELGNVSQDIIAIPSQISKPWESIVEKPGDVDTDEGGVATKIGGAEGGIGTGGMVIYLTQHFERDSVSLRGQMIDAESFRKMMGKIFKEELG